MKRAAVKVAEAVENGAQLVSLPGYKVKIITVQQLKVNGPYYFIFNNRTQKQK